MLDEEGEALEEEGEVVGVEAREGGDGPVERVLEHCVVDGAHVLQLPPRQPVPALPLSLALPLSRALALSRARRSAAQPVHPGRATHPSLAAVSPPSTSDTNPSLPETALSQSNTNRTEENAERHARRQSRRWRPACVARKRVCHPWRRSRRTRNSSSTASVDTWQPRAPASALALQSRHIDIAADPQGACNRVGDAAS
eukprot:1133623-Rhodomonas_salina.5